MPLADGRAIVPGLVVRPADPAADARALEGLARRADRFTPRIMPDGVDTLFLDIAGSPVSSAARMRSWTRWLSCP